jgi:hypothetical protein
MITLCETTNYKIEHEYENTFIFDKIGQTIVYQTTFYGDPKCAIIDKNNKWLAIGGDRFLIWKNGNITDTLNPENLIWIHDLRQVDSHTIQILTDPWKDDSAIWEIDISTLKVNKIRDFPEYRNTPYTDKEIVW